MLKPQLVHKNVKKDLRYKREKSFDQLKEPISSPSDRKLTISPSEPVTRSRHNSAHRHNVSPLVSDRSAKSSTVKSSGKKDAAVGNYPHKSEGILHMSPQIIRNFSEANNQTRKAILHASQSRSRSLFKPKTSGDLFDNIISRKPKLDPTLLKQSQQYFVLSKSQISKNPPNSSRRQPKLAPERLEDLSLNNSKVYEDVEESLIIELQDPYVESSKILKERKEKAGRERYQDLFSKKKK